MIGGELDDTPPWEHFGRIVGELACILALEFACTPALGLAWEYFGTLVWELAWGPACTPPSARYDIPPLELAWKLVLESFYKTVSQPSWELSWAPACILVWGHCGTLPLEPGGILPWEHSCTALLVSALAHSCTPGEAHSCTPAWELAWKLAHTFLQELAWGLVLEFLCTLACQLCCRPA